MPAVAIVGLFVSGTHLAADEITTVPLWQIDKDAPVYGKPVIHGDFIFAAGEDGVLHAIDKSSGDIEWEYRATAGIGSSVGFDDKRVYVHSRDGIVHGIDKSTGEGIWTFATNGEKQWDHWDLYLSTPVADDQHWLYFGSGDHHVYSINKRTGTLRWKFRTGAVVHGDPVLSGQKVIVGGFDGRMYALDRADGSLMWSFKTVGNAYFRAGEIPGSAAVADGLVYFGSRDYNLYAVLEETGTGAWNERTPSWVVARPLVLDGVVYVATSDSPRVYAFDAKGGMKAWETPLGLNVFGGAEGLGATHIAVPGLGGRINFVDRKTGTITGFHDTREAARNRSDFFDSEGSLRVRDIRSFEDLFALYDRYFAELGGIAGGLAVEGDVIYYATGTGTVAAVRVSGLPGDTPQD